LTSSVSASSMSPNLVLPYETDDCPVIGKFFLLEPYLMRQASRFTKSGGEPIFRESIRLLDFYITSVYNN
jgi:hypothetical protein